MSFNKLNTITRIFVTVLLALCLLTGCKPAAEKTEEPAAVPAATEAPAAEEAVAEEPAAEEPAAEEAAAEEAAAEEPAAEEPAAEEPAAEEAAAEEAVAEEPAAEEAAAEEPAAEEAVAEEPATEEPAAEEAAAEEAAAEEPAAEEAAAEEAAAEEAADEEPAAEEAAAEEPAAEEAAAEEPAAEEPAAEEAQADAVVDEIEEEPAIEAGIVADVDGDSISAEAFSSMALFVRYQYLAQYQQYAQLYSSYGLPLDSLNEQFEEILGENSQEAMGGEIIDRLVYDKILEKEAEKIGYEVSEQDVIDQMKGWLGYEDESDTEETVAGMSSYNVDLDSFKDAEDLNATFKGYADAVLAYSYQSDAINYDFLANYSRHSLLDNALFEKELENRVFEAEMVNARHILVEDEATAKEVQEKLAAGEAWEDLASQYSIDESNKEDAGNLGWFGRGEMVSEFEEAAFALEEGETSEPVQTSYGYHLINSLGKEVRPLEGNALQSAQNQAYTEWTTGLRAAYDIKNYPDVWMGLVPTEPAFTPIESEPAEEPAEEEAAAEEPAVEEPAVEETAVEEAAAEEAAEEAVAEEAAEEEAVAEEPAAEEAAEEEAVAEEPAAEEAVAEEAAAEEEPAAEEAVAEEAVAEEAAAEEPAAEEEAVAEEPAAEEEAVEEAAEEEAVAEEAAAEEPAAEEAAEEEAVAEEPAAEEAAEEEAVAEEPAAEEEAVKEDVIAEVDGKEIGNDAFRKYATFVRYQYLVSYEMYAQIYAMYGLGLDELNAQMESILGEEGRDTLVNTIADALVFDEVLKIEAENAGIEISDSEMLDGMKNMLSYLGIFEEEAAEETSEDGSYDVELDEEKDAEDEAAEFKAHTEALLNEAYNGAIDYEFLEEQTRCSIYAQKLFALAMEDRTFEAEMVNARHILVEDEETAKDIKAKLDAGEDWADLASENSLDTSNKDNSGALGWFARGVMVSEFEEAAFALEPGEISDPVKTDYGYHIIASDGKEVRPLEGSALEQAQNELYGEWVDELRAKHEIKTYPEGKAELMPTEPAFEPLQLEDLYPEEEAVEEAEVEEAEVEELAAEEAVAEEAEEAVEEAEVEEAEVEELTIDNTEQDDSSFTIDNDAEVK